MNEHVTRTVPVTMKMVVDAYKKVRQGGEAPGIDGESWKDFEAKAQDNVYVIWNRLSSGSYYPQAVRETEIPKKDGSTRKLGIPTLRDRIAQCVVKDYIEQRIDEQFSKHSYGYRPMKSSKEAIEEVRQNCYQYDWVIDMDIEKFFDQIDHELLMKALEHVIEEKWVRMYVKRWLEMKIVSSKGKEYDRGGKGTPQGGVISPILANLFLHYAIDKWLEKHYSEISFVRYADDVIIHCRSKEEAESIMKAIEGRLEEVKLKLNRKKTHIVYCKDYRRRGDHGMVKFEFLGYSYRPRGRQSGGSGGSYVAFAAAISDSNARRIREEIRRHKAWRDPTIGVEQIGKELESKLRGWINYYGCYSKRELRKVLQQVDKCLMKWIRDKYKIGGYRKAVIKIEELKRRMKTEGRAIFYHWGAGYC